MLADGKLPEDLYYRFTSSTSSPALRARPRTSSAAQHVPRPARRPPDPARAGCAVPRASTSCRLPRARQRPELMNVLRARRRLCQGPELIARHEDCPLHGAREAPRRLPRRPRRSRMNLAELKSASSVRAQVLRRRSRQQTRRRPAPRPRVRRRLIRKPRRVLAGRARGLGPCPQPRRPAGQRRYRLTQRPRPAWPLDARAGYRFSIFAGVSAPFCTPKPLHDDAAGPTPRNRCSRNPHDLGCECCRSIATGATVTQHVERRHAGLLW